MAKKSAAPAVATGVEVVEDLHAVEAQDGVEFTDVTGKDDLPLDVVDVDDEDEKKKTTADPKVVKDPKTGRFQKADATTEDEVPEEYKGKTVAQIAKMHKDAQALIGRQGSELGELRRAADKYIRAHLEREAAPAATAPKKEEPAKPWDDVEFFANPKASVERLIAEHPALKDLQGTTRTYAEREIIRTRQAAEREFNTAHPDAEAVLADEAFREWVVKSPIRQQMMLYAHRNYDLNAANELFNTWKELKAARTPTPTPTPTPKPVGKPAAPASAARVPTGGNAAPVGNASAEKIYRRADIIRLHNEDPARYELMADEITKAYQEGRVR